MLCYADILQLSEEYFRSNPPTREGFMACLREAFSRQILP